VPSSKVGSLDSASAATERESGVEAAGLASGLVSDLASGLRCGGVDAGLAAPIGAAVAGLAEGATTEFWQNALSVTNSMAIARMVLFGIFQSTICAGRRLQYRMRAFNAPIRGF
jgi:hypothetical protein